MRRLSILVLVLLVIGPTGVVLAARAPQARLCVTVVGAPDDITADELTEGIVDGSYTIASVRPCPTAPDGGGGGGRPSPGHTAPPPIKDTGQWVVNPITRDPLTDDPITATWVFADGSRSAALFVECLSRGMTQVRISWTVFLDLETADITTRIADEEPVTQAWPLDETGTSSFYPTDPLVFLARLFGQGRLVAQTKPWNWNETTLVFPIAGIESAIANVRTACGW